MCAREREFLPFYPTVSPSVLDEAEQKPPVVLETSSGSEGSCEANGSISRVGFILPPSSPSHPTFLWQGKC